MSMEKQADPEKESMKMIEAALFVSGKAMGVSELAGALGVASIGYVRDAAEKLVAQYSNRDCAISVIKIGEKYIMGLREPYAGKVNGLAGQPDISGGALRALAYISKNEPILQSSMSKSFGPSVYIYVKELIDSDFIKASRSGRTKRLETTQKFKEYFNF